MVAATVICLWIGLKQGEATRGVGLWRPLSGTLIHNIRLVVISQRRRDARVGDYALLEKVFLPCSGNMRLLKDK